MFAAAFAYIELKKNSLIGGKMKEKVSVLVVDDEYKILEAVAAYLINKNFNVYTAETGNAALNILNGKKVDFVVLDLMLPDISGEEVCSRIRKHSSVPIIMLTAKSQEEDILKGLDIGADDYIVKPFSLKQLYARMEAVLRRTSDSIKPAATVFTWNDGDLKADFSAMELYKRGEKIYLTSSEWKLFAALVKQPHTVFTREKLIELVWGCDFDSYDRVIDTHIKNLRKKIETDTKTPQYVLTVRGSGYKFGGEK